MAIYTDAGRAMMAKAFFHFASGDENDGDSPLWFGFARGLTSNNQPDYGWNTLTPISSAPVISSDSPPDPITYPGPHSSTLVNTNSSATLPVKYYQSPTYSPDVYKRVNAVQYIYPDEDGEIIYLDNTYSAYVDDQVTGKSAEELAMEANCNLVRVSTFLSSIELHQININPENFTTRQIGLYKDIDAAFVGASQSLPVNHPNLLSAATDLGTLTEADFGLSLIDNTLPYNRIDYQRDIFSFVLQF